MNKSIDTKRRLFYVSFILSIAVDIIALILSSIVPFGELFVFSIIFILIKLLFVLFTLLFSLALKQKWWVVILNTLFSLLTIINYLFFIFVPFFNLFLAEKKSNKVNNFVEKFAYYVLWYGCGILLFIFYIIAWYSFFGGLGLILAFPTSPGLLIFPFIWWGIQGVFPTFLFTLWSASLFGRYLMHLTLKNRAIGNKELSDAITILSER